MSGSLELRSLRLAPAAKTDWTEGKGGCLNVSEIRELMIVGDDSSRKDKIIDKEELLNKLLNKSTIITSFSVGPEDVPILEQFRQIAKREAGPRGFSQVLIKAMQEYNKRHGIGNPQLLITHYAKAEEPQPMHVLCIYCQGALTDGRVFCQRKGMWIPGVSCYSCKFNRLRKQK
ncbi:MAG: hypothetical protein QXQ94_08505 [Candidatus Bathyarchaeia archaeon]